LPGGLGERDLWYFSWKLGLSRVTLDGRTVLAETEGLAFLATSDGAQMHALDAVSGRLATYLYNYRQAAS
jgi:hypothetical protein